MAEKDVGKAAMSSVQEKQVALRGMGSNFIDATKYHMSERIPTIPAIVYTSLFCSFCFLLFSSSRGGQDKVEWETPGGTVKAMLCMTSKKECTTF